MKFEGYLPNRNCVITEKTLEHAMTRQQFGKELVQFEAIKHKFSKMAVAVYAMESMSYMTAGIIDAYQKPDASIEAAIVKVMAANGSRAPAGVLCFLGVLFVEVRWLFVFS